MELKITISTISEQLYQQKMIKNTRLSKKSGFNLIALVLVWIMLCHQSINAEIKLPAIVSSNMVLQRDTTIVLWGWADPNEEITIKISWLEEKINFNTDKEGNWRTEIKTNNSKEAHSIAIESKTSQILLENILFGEVWLCSGQSNMEQPLRGYDGQPIFGSSMAIATSTNANLRLFNVDKVNSETPLKDIEKFTGWRQASPDATLNFSAVAYFFGKQLQEILDCPVGIIHSSWGGSPVHAWLSKEALEAYPATNLNDVPFTKDTNSNPSVLFNAMINPLIPYTIKGALWYQGESDRHDPENYKKLFPALVKDWRSRWSIGDFPFYYVQIAPYSYGNNQAYETAENTAFIREVQLQSLDVIPNSGIVITMDIGDENSIHPPKKKEVADRLLFNALHNTYGFKTIDAASPMFDSQKLKDGGLLLKFKNAETGLYFYDDLKDFEIAGADKMFYPAHAQIVNGKNVFVKSDKVMHPVAVRYAWRNYVNGTLYDTNLLPASSFRTDNWDDATKVER